MSTAPTVRAGITADAEAVALLAERSFRAAFAADNSADDLEAYVREAFSVDRIRSELADSASTFLILLLEGRGGPMGYAKLRRGPADPSVRGPDPVELERLYVDPDAIGSGLGAALMRACLDAAVAAGHGTLWLGVWERNARARAFYSRWGFEAVGEHVFRLGSDDQRDIVMERRL